MVSLRAAFVLLTVASVTRFESSWHNHLTETSGVERGKRDEALDDFLHEPPTVALTTGLYFTFHLNLTDEGGAVQQLGKFIRVPVKGLYWLEVNVCANLDAEAADVSIKVDSVTKVNLSAGGSGWIQGGTAVILALSPGQQIELNTPATNNFYTGVRSSVYSTVTMIKIADF